MQAEPDNAPRVVVSVGTLSEVEDKIITPAIRSYRRVLDTARRVVLPGLATHLANPQGLGMAVL